MMISWLKFIAISDGSITNIVPCLLPVRLVGRSVGRLWSRRIPSQSYLISRSTWAREAGREGGREFQKRLLCVLCKCRGCGNLE